MSEKINRIVLATQKGGVGKSTIATMLASYMYFVKDHSVVVIDADSPQHTIKKLRDRELARFKQDEAMMRAFTESGKSQIYPITESRMDHVFERPAPDRPSTFEKASHPKIDADTVIIDTPGSVAIEGLGNILRNVDRVIIPLEPEEMSLVSATEFLTALGSIGSNQKERPKPIAFWNKVLWRSHEELVTAQNEVFRAAGIHVLTNYIPYSVKLKRTETRSTIFPVNFRAIDLSGFMEELYQTTK